MVSTDELNTTLADLRSGWQSTFARTNAFLNQCVEKRKTRTTDIGGTHIEKVLMTGAPSQGVGVSGGYEVAPGTRIQKSKQLKIAYYEFFQPIQISGKEMRENGGRQGIVKLIEMYPDAAVKAFKKDFNKYLLTGTTDSASSASPNDHFGFLTLNGGFSSGTVDGTTNGVLDFRTPAQQTSDAETVEGVVKSEASGHYNQYQAISAWASDGRRLIQTAYMDAEANADQDGGESVGPDLMIMDRATMANFIESKADTTRIQIVDAKTEGKASTSNSFYRAKVIYDAALDRALFASPASGGVTYGLNTDYWMWYILHDVDITPFADFLATQDVVTSKLLFHGQGMCERLNTQFCVSGGAT